MWATPSAAAAAALYPTVCPFWRGARGASSAFFKCRRFHAAISPPPLSHLTYMHPNDNSHSRHPPRARHLRTAPLHPRSRAGRGARVPPEAKAVPGRRQRAAAAAAATTPALAPRQTVVAPGAEAAAAAAAVATTRRRRGSTAETAILSATGPTMPTAAATGEVAMDGTLRPCWLRTSG